MATQFHDMRGPYLKVLARRFVTIANESTLIYLLAAFYAPLISMSGGGYHFIPPHLHDQRALLVAAGLIFGLRPAVRPFQMIMSGIIGVCGWGIVRLSQRGVIALDEQLPIRRLLSSRKRRSFLVYLGRSLALSCCIIAPWVLIWIGAFWAQWGLIGTIRLDWTLWITLLSLLASALAMASPLGGWVYGLFSQAWLKPVAPEGAWPILVIDEASRAGWLGRAAHDGSLRMDGERLELRVGRKDWTIGRDAVLEIAPAGWTQKILFQTMFAWRSLVRPVRLRWWTREGEQLVEHRLLLAAQGAGALSAWRADGRLAEAMKDWREDLSPWPVESTSPKNRRLMFAAGFVATALFLPLLHNHLILTKLRTNAWPPMAHSKSAGKPAPYLSATNEAVNPQAMYASVVATRPSHNDFGPSRVSDEPVSFSVIGRINPFPTGFQPVAMLASMDWLAANGPGEPTHLFRQYANCWLNTALIPTLTTDYLNRTNHHLWPDQVLDLRTGRTWDIRCLPIDFEQAPHRFAIYQGETLFYSREKDLHEQTRDPATGGCQWVRSTEADFGWVDVKADTRHPLGKLRISEKGRPEMDPVFFPGGRHVLYAWRVVDIKTGQITPIERPKSDEWAVGYISLWGDVFTRGQRLAIQVNTSRQIKVQIKDGVQVSTTTLKKDDPNSYLGVMVEPSDFGEYKPLFTGTSYRTQEQWEIWELDPASTQVKRIALPESMRLISADQNRWLLRENRPRPLTKDEQRHRAKPYRYTHHFHLLDATTGRTRSLSIQQTIQNIMLVKGRNEALVYDESGSWSTIALPETK